MLGGGGSKPELGEQPGAGAGARRRQRPRKSETPTAEAAEELGYPSFATNNTTRVGGSDPATTAAGVALAVFPSTSRRSDPPP